MPQLLEGRSREGGYRLVLSLPGRHAPSRAKLGKELASGARVISFNFPIPGWKHEAVLRADSKLHNDPIYIYRIPDCLPGRHP